MQPEATSETGGKTRCPGTSARRKISPIRWLADRVLPPGSLEGFFFEVIVAKIVLGIANQ